MGGAGRKTGPFSMRAAVENEFNVAGAVQACCCLRLPAVEADLHLSIRFAMRNQRRFRVIMMDTQQKRPGSRLPNMFINLEPSPS